ncbi:TIGR02234 family membrane protein [Corynebacterium glaucum]|uniref:TIGR02234 family membrane protein n=1 Tax=Corynebacterium glaucum TaxID=187491 RepID=UPI002659B2B5|nr:TIGR02234 family membrane protein [Corynebacterium glaucum]
MTQPTDKGLSRTGAALIGLGAALLWIASRLTWVSAGYTDDLSGNGVVSLTGAGWSLETTAVALLLLVGMIGAFALRRLGRRIVGAVSAIAAAAVAISPVQLLIRGADPERVHAILASRAEVVASPNAGDTIGQWAEITAVDVPNTGPVLAVVGCTLALVGGLLVAVRPGADAPKQNKYEKETVRREHIREDMEARPDSGRVMWDALDADIDPTDTDSKG